MSPVTKRPHASAPLASPIQVTLRPIAALIPYSRNARTHSPEQVKQIAASIKEFGWTNPVLVDGANGIIAGHGRMQAAQLLGLDEVPCIELAHLSETQRRAYILADNKLALNADWDEAMLALELDELKALDFDIELTGFSLDEVADIAAEVIPPIEAKTDPDDVPEVPPAPITRLGDVWLLGRHRVMCGDSTNINAVETLMAGEKAAMVFADPPYGINHSGKGIAAKAAAHDFGEILGDGDIAVAVDCYNLVVGMYPEARLVFWGANYYPSALPNGGGWLVWDKEREGAVFSGAELAFVNRGVRMDVFRHQWHGMIKASEHGQARVHPTQKPVALAEWCFSNYGNPKIVLDPFGGSGSTLLACERTGRTCRSMELDPAYCDVSVRRWQEFTGQKATLEGDGRTFDEVAAGAPRAEA